jgi:ABC-2 type transport system permease protein
MKPIIRWSIWERRGTIIGWSAGISAYIAINILVYSSIATQAQALNKALSGLPPTAQALFGTNGGDFLSPVGYLNSKLYYLILPLLFTLLAVNLANSLLAREEQSGTLELLLARPISRGKLLLAKLIAGLIIVALVGLITLAVTAICIQSISYDISPWRVMQAHALTLLLGLLFGAVAWALVGVGRFGRRASVGIAGFIALGSYLFTSLESFASWLKWPAKLLPYHYYQPTAVLEGSFNWRHAGGMLLAALIILGIAFLGFRRRDIG